MNKIEKLIKEYNLYYLKLTNKTHKIGKYDLPYVNCNLSIKPDYLALYSEQYLYNKTDATCVCFFKNDDEFDGWCGLWCAIYYNVPELLAHYKERFKNVKYMIAPDYSQVEDIENFENYYRLAKARIVSLWLTIEMGIIVIPLLTYSKKVDFEYMLNGMERTTTLAVSLEGCMQKPDKAKLAKEAIEYAVEHLPNLRTIVVYSTSVYSAKELNFFRTAIDKGIEIVVPMNSLKKSHIKAWEKYHGKNK